MSLHSLLLHGGVQRSPRIYIVCSVPEILHCPLGQSIVTKPNISVKVDIVPAGIHTVHPALKVCSCANNASWSSCSLGVLSGSSYDLLGSPVQYLTSHLN